MKLIELEQERQRRKPKWRGNDWLRQIITANARKEDRLRKEREQYNKKLIRELKLNKKEK